MNFRVIGIGEVLWDLLPSGPQIGGAPANFAFHARQLGAEARVISRVGKDEYGRRIFRHFQDGGIVEDTLQVDDLWPTGTAKVALGNDGVPHFIVEKNAAWDFMAITDEALQAAAAADAICFGSLAQRNETAANTIRTVVAMTSPEALRVFDINLRQNSYGRAVIEESLDIANVLKLNDDELKVLAGYFNLNGTIHQQMEQLAEDFNLRLVALTRGANGSLLYQAGDWSDLPGETVKVVDTVGAGDSFLAALVMGLLNKTSLRRTHEIASQVSRYVCSRPGATPDLPQSLRASFANAYVQANGG